MPKSARQLEREITKYLGADHAKFVSETDRKITEAIQRYGNAYADDNGYNHQLYIDANRAAEIKATLRNVKKERTLQSRLDKTRQARKEKALAAVSKWEIQIARKKRNT